jgi:hypothetical protein
VIRVGYLSIRDRDDRDAHLGELIALDVLCVRELREL